MKPHAGRGVTRELLEKVRSAYNHRSYVDPDPLLFLYDYEDPGDREIVGMVASSLAYGRAVQIMGSVERVLVPMGQRPSLFLAKASLRELEDIYQGFRYRFTTGVEVARLLFSVKRLVETYGSLEGCFVKGLRSDRTVLPALSRFAKEIRKAAPGLERHIIPDPDKGSACKRLNLFLRWMVRRDAVDPGGWDRVSSCLLIVPLDTHMHRIGGCLAFTTRMQADMRTALEITEGFRRFAPEDPVRYDFALTRIGMRGRIVELPGSENKALSKLFSSR